MKDLISSTCLQPYNMDKRKYPYEQRQSISTHLFNISP